MGDLILVFLCLFVLFVVGFVWLISREAKPNTATLPAPPPPASSATLPAPPPPASSATPVAPAPALRDFSALDQLVARWGRNGELAPEVVAQVRALIAREASVAVQPVQTPQRGVSTLAAPVMSPVASVASVAPAASTPPVVSVDVGAQPAASVAVQPVQTPQRGVSTLAAPVTLPMAPAASVAPAASTPPVASVTPVAPPPITPRVARPALGAALLALGTRRTLLFLGTFLLLMSSLTLVVFNWASLAPIVQFAILAGTTGAIWAGGAWMLRQRDLATAGRNLQAVAALLMPVVGFALGRPGLLDLEARPAWLLASALSLGAYLLASWRTRQSFYSGAAALATVSLLVAALGAVATAWQFVLVNILLIAMLPVVEYLRVGKDPQVAEGPRWVALIGGPVTLFGAALFYLSDPVDGYAFATSLAAGTLFCWLAYRLEKRVVWLWVAVALAPAAVQVALRAADSSLALHTLALAGCGLIYFGLCAALERRQQPVLAPLFTGALGLGLLALPLVCVDLPAARLALPPLILMSVGTVALIERERLAWLGARRPTIATGSLATAAGLLFGWLGALLFGWTDSLSVSALWLLPLVAVYFAGARWWQGRERVRYDQVLQTAGVVVACIAGPLMLADSETRLLGTLLIAVIFGGQALVRRRWAWAAVSLTFGALVASFAVQRFVPFDEQLRASILVTLGLTIGYSLGGERLRHTALSYWTRPAVVLALLNGLFAAANALVQVSVSPGLFTGVLLALALLLGAHTALWRRGELGYPAAGLLVVATLVAASEGFFTGWRPAPGDLGYVCSAMALGFGLLGHGLRRYGRAYALPYERVAFVILPVAPLLAASDPAHLTLTWWSLAGLYGLALWRYKLPWMLALAFFALDLALLQGAAWLVPGGNPAGAGLILVAAVVGQTVFSAWARRRPAPLDAAGLWGYLSAGLGGVGALALASSSAGHGATVAGLLAALAAWLVWVEVREELAWAALGLLALALGQFHHSLGFTPTGNLLAGCLEALTIYIGGWGVQALTARLPRLAPWHRPFAYGGGVALVLLPLYLGGWGVTLGEPVGGTALLLLGLGVGLVGWRQRIPPLAGVTLSIWALALVTEGPTSNPTLWASLGAYFLLALTWTMGGAALAKRLVAATRRSAAGPAIAQLPPAEGLHQAVYGAAALTGLLALTEAHGTSMLAVVFLGLAALAALVATAERAEAVAWASLGLAVIGASFAHVALGLASSWAMAWLVLELVGVSLAGWVAALAGVAAWRRPTTVGAAGAGVLLMTLVGLLALFGPLPPLTFALASLGLLLATVAVRERELHYAYVAGAAFVAAALCQFADWGLREPQWYVIPAGLYLLAIAAGLRRFQGQHRASQVVETAAVLLLLGVTFVQSIRDDGGLLYSLWLFGEALAVAAYGALVRLRVPFVGGVAFFVAGVTWMTVDTVRLANQWVLLGAAGLLMVAAYVILERHQERLVRTGRHWMTQLQSWG